MRERQTSRYATAVAELERYAEGHRFEGIGSFYAWERLTLLVGHLKTQFDAFELEGDADPVREAIDGYHHDLWSHHIKPDRGIHARLDELLTNLAPAPWADEVEMLVSTVPAAPTQRYSEHLLTVRPETLLALLTERGAPQGPDPAA